MGYELIVSNLYFLLGLVILTKAYYIHKGHHVAHLYLIAATLYLIIGGTYMLSHIKHSKEKGPSKF